MLLQELKKLQLQKEIISIRRICGDEDQTGSVEWVNDDILVFCLYTDDGVFDGYSVFYTVQIEELMWGNREHQSIAQLVKLHGDKPPFLGRGTRFEELLMSLAKQYSSLAIFTDDESSFDIATIEAVTEEWTKIKTFGPKKTLSPLFKLIKTDDIGRVDVDSPYQNNIVALHSTRITGIK